MVLHVRNAFLARCRVQMEFELVNRVHSRCIPTSDNRFSGLVNRRKCLSFSTKFVMVISYMNKQFVARQYSRCNGEATIVNMFFDLDSTFPWINILLFINKYGRSLYSSLWTGKAFFLRRSDIFTAHFRANRIYPFTTNKKSVEMKMMDFLDILLLTMKSFWFVRIYD